ncbi:MAG TPA: isoprenylcysteine carboxylmethyltransferase family protein [Acidobacteriaceae bacterium]|nr:isoprenylcysteine carboxylmethyltransferase family protein [Acidobacteriaceae bacterium]
MRLLYDNPITLMWLAFLLYWRIMARGARTTQRMEPAGSRILRMILFLGAIVLFLWHSIPVRWLHVRVLPLGYACYNIGIVLTAAGIALAVWARVHLGANWSRSVTVKQDHELITTGPYRLVRHPIYTGILLGILGSAVAPGQVRGLIAIALISWALWRKLRLEESWMREQFGDSYANYSRHTAALVPGLL